MKLITLIISATLFFGGISDTLKSKANNTIRKYFSSEKFTTKNISIDNISEFQDIEKSNKEINQIIGDDKSTIGYTVISRAKGRFDYFEFIVIYNASLEIKLVKVLEYSSGRGAEICAKSWLKQFTQKNQKLEYGKNIDALSGATISAESITADINLINTIMSTLKSKNIL